MCFEIRHLAYKEILFTLCMFFFFIILQVYLISFAVQWNSRMEKMKVAGQKGPTLVDDPRQIQRMNTQEEVLYGKEHVYNQNFRGPMLPPTNPEEEELLGVEYAVSQSTAFSSKHYYTEKGESCIQTFIQMCLASV